MSKKVINQDKMNEKKEQALYQSQIIQQSSLQLNLASQLKLALSNYEESLRKLLKKGSQLDRSDYNSWHQLDFQLYKSKQEYILKVGQLIRNLNYTDSIDQETKERLNSKFDKLYQKSFQFTMYIGSVKYKNSFLNFMYCPIQKKFVEKEKVEIVLWAEKVFDLQAYETAWQEKIASQRKEENQKKIKDLVSKIQKPASLSCKQEK